MSIELTTRDLQIIVSTDKIGFINFLRSLNFDFEKHEGGVILFHARCFDSDFQYIITRRFLEGYPTHLTFSRKSEDYTEYGVQELYQQSQVILEKHFGQADFQEENIHRGTRKHKWTTEQLVITHLIGERFMLYEIITIKSSKDDE